jgi:hypothetical protein
MHWTKLSGIAMVAALIAAPGTAHADEPVPTVDQVVGIMQQLTDPNIPAANKGNIVTPGFSPEEAGTTDDHLNRMNAIRLLPLNFVVTDIQPAPGNLAGATVSTTGSFWQVAYPKPIVLDDQAGHWQITHDSAMDMLHVFWFDANRRMGAPGV